MTGHPIRTGLFGGSFNPIHIGHLAIANYLCEYEGLDEVWFLVTPLNPLKEHSWLLDDTLRLELVKAAIDGYPRFHASDFEFHLPRPSYMIYTMDKLKESYPDRLFCLLIGSDNWRLFGRWYEHERLLRENPVMVYPRPDFPVDAVSLPPGVRLVNAPLLNVSSTFIREGLKEGKDLRFFLPPAVHRLITERKLYR